MMANADVVAVGEGLESRWRPTQADFDRFAVISGDDNPIHVDPEFSARTRFGRTVSHGMLLYSRVWALIRANWPGRHLLQELMFPNPAYADEELVIALTPVATNPRMLEVCVRRVADGAIVLQGKCELDEGAGQ